jgi:small-conductance mechanosensitive channel
MSLLADVASAPASTGVSFTQLIVALVALWAALGAAVGLIRQRYESELRGKDKRIERFEVIEAERRAADKQVMATLEQAVAIAKAQNETINTVVEKQGALLNKIAERQEEAKSTATRRARPT